MSSHKTQIVQLTIQRIDQAVQILARSFLGMNDIWKSFHPVYQQIVPFVKHKILQSTKAGLAYFLEVDGKMAGLTVQFDAVDYLNMPPFQTNSNLFNTLGKYGKLVQTPISEGNYQKGECVIGAYGVIDPQYASKGYTIDFWYQGFHGLQNMKFKHYYSRLSHPVSLIILKKFGAQEVKSIEFEEEQLKGHKLTLVKIDFTKPLPTLQSLKKKKEKKQ